MDKFFKFEKEAWEDKYLEYGELEATDNNFVDEYRINLTEEVGGDCGEELNRFISVIQEQQIRFMTFQR